MTLSELQKVLDPALTLALPYAERNPREGGTPAAVLALLAEHSGETSLLLTRRTELVDTHKGQMAFPGGRSELDEIGVEGGAIRTALRETFEEVGIPPELVHVRGTLPPLWTITGFWVTPVVGILSSAVDQVPIVPQVAEIAETVWVPLSVLRAPGTYQRELRRIGAVDYPIHVYQVGPHRIWGATGAMIKNLLDRLEAVG